MPVKPLQIIACLVLGLVLASGTGCSKIKKARAQERAERYMKEGEYEKARLEYMTVLLLDRQNYSALANSGRIYYERGQVLSALPFLRTARKLNTNDLEVAVQLGMCYQSIFELKKAREEAEFVLARNPAHDEAVLLLSETAQQDEDIALVKNRIDELRKRAGERAGFYTALATMSMRQNKMKEAEVALTEALKLDPKFPAALVAMGNIVWSQEDLEKANTYFEAAANVSPIRSARRLRGIDLKLHMGAIDEAKKILKKITDQVNDHIPALVYQSKIAFAERNYEESLRLNQKILALDRINFDALLLDARSKLGQKKAMEAIKDLEKMRTMYTKSPELLYYIGLAYLVLEDMDKAMVAFTQSASFEPNYDPAAVLLAELYLRKGNPVSAVQLLVPIIRKYPNQARSYLLLAQAYLDQERWDSVIEVYQKLSTIFPKDAEPHYKIGTTFRRQKKTDEARQAFLKAYELDPKHMQALNQLVEMDITEKKYDDAWKRIEADMARNPQSPDLVFLTAKVHIAQNDIPKAEAALLKALELNPAYQPAYSALAEVYSKAGKPEEALKKLQDGIAKNPQDLISIMKAATIYESLKDYPNAARTYEQLLGINPRFTPALNNLAYLYSERLDNLDKAYAMAQKAREYSPNDPYTADTLGWVLFKRGEYSYALKLIKDCVDRLPENSPNFSEVLYHLGMAYYMTGAEENARTTLAKAVAAKDDFFGREEAEARLALLNTDVSKSGAEVIPQLEASLAKQPKDIIVLLRLGSAYERAGEYEKAKTTFEKALQVNPTSVPALVNLARLYVGKLDNSQKALELAKSARHLAPTDTDVLELLAPLAFKARDYQLALTLFQERQQKQSGHPDVLFHLGLSYFNLGKISEAENIMRELIRVAPGAPQVEGAKQFLALIDIYNNPGEAAAAESVINNALKSDPEYVPALFALAIVQERQGKFTEARQAYEKILADNPRFNLAAKRLGILYAEHFNEDQKAKDLLTKAKEGIPNDFEITRTLGILAYKRADYRYAAQLLREVRGAQSKPDAALLYYLGMAQYHLKQKNESKASLTEALALNDKDKFGDEARRILKELK